MLRAKLCNLKNKKIIGTFKDVKNEVGLFMIFSIFLVTLIFKRKITRKSSDLLNIV